MKVCEHWKIFGSMEMFSSDSINYYGPFTDWNYCPIDGKKRPVIKKKRQMEEKRK